MLINSGPDFVTSGPESILTLHWNCSLLVSVSLYAEISCLSSVSGITKTQRCIFDDNQWIILLTLLWVLLHVHKN